MAANEEYFDLALRHQIALRRLASGEVRRILRILDEADAELIVLLRERLARLGGSTDITSARYKALQRSVRDQRAELMSDIRTEIRSTIGELTAVEAAFERTIISQALPVRLELAKVDLTRVRASVVSKPFSGGNASARTLSQWFESLERADRTRILEAVQLGVAQGEPVPVMVRRIAGTRAAGFRDGVLQTSRRNAETVVRTATNHVSTVAREAVWEANSDIIRGLRWVSTLDGRTTAICRGRDGAIVLLGSETSMRELPRTARLLRPQGARPPAHPNCRSIMVAFFDVQGIAEAMSERPFVRDTRTRKFREKDFRREAREVDPARWRTLSRQQRNAEIARLRRAWTEANVGRVPGKVTYNDWLRKQPRDFVEDVLGQKKADLYLKGRIHLDEFTDASGKELTLARLKETRPALFQ